MVFYLSFSPQLARIIFPKQKKKKESVSIEVMMNENGGSIPTGSEEWTLHLLYFYLDDLITTKGE